MQFLKSLAKVSGPISTNTFLTFIADQFVVRLEDHGLPAGIVNC